MRLFRRSPARVAAFRLCFLLILSLCQVPAAQKQTALDRYVQAADPSYRYQLVKTVAGKGYTLFQIDMTSQTWRQPSEVDRTEWRHWLNIIRPDGSQGKIGMLFISGGSNQDTVPKGPDGMLLGIAREANIVVAELRMVPNQPLSFEGGQPRKEDELIAYTWDKFLKTGDEYWPARLPMTKSAVRAMDTVTAFCKTAAGGSLGIEQYIVSGGSKRGWTTWTTAAVDRRVIAIIPCVIDLLNLTRSFQHHWMAYGFWAPAVGNYVELGLMDRMDHPRWNQLMQLVEPYSYRDRLTLPKLMINASGDQFFLPDSSRFYFQDLKGEKYLRYVPNADHSLKNTDAAESILAFVQSVVKGIPRPQFEWKFQGADTIRLKSRTQPKEVRLWQATNPKARDFRLETLGAVWESRILPSNGDGVYLGRVSQPASGWTAFFLEVTYPGPGKVPYKFTSGVRVNPDALPYPKPSSKGYK